MAELSLELLELLKLPGTVATLATSDELGTPYAVASPFLQAGPAGELVHLELLEKSATNRHLLRSLWFDKKATVSVTAPDGRSYVVIGKPAKVLITGPIFRYHYQEVRAALPDADLAAVWLIEAEEVVEETYSVRKRQEEELFPFTVHLDRFAVPASSGQAR